MPEPTPSQLSRLIPLLQLGFAVGAVRYACEFIAPQYSMFFGLYYIMPIAILIIGLSNTWGDISWRALAGTMFLTGILCWGIANTAAYTTGQFLGWTHGRFDESRAAALAETDMMKIVVGLAQGVVTGILGGIWCIIFGSLFIWIPTRMRARVTT